MKAVLVEGPGQAALTTLPDPRPADDEIVLAVGGCGICGTDLHILEHELPTAPYPLVPGHERWGRVVALGRDVRSHVIGDRVAIDPSLHCGHCRFCRRGRGNLCESWGAIGATRRGAWAEYVAASAANAYPLAESVSDEAAALAEPVACALRGIERLAPEPGDDVVVFGAGTMGLLLAHLLVAGGAGAVTLVEPNAERRRFATEVWRADRGRYRLRGGARAGGDRRHRNPRRARRGARRGRAGRDGREGGVERRRRTAVIRSTWSPHLDVGLCCCIRGAGTGLAAR